MKYVYYLIVDLNPVEEIRTSHLVSKDEILYNYVDDYDFSRDRALIGGCWYDYDEVSVERMC